MDETDRAIVNRLQGGFPLCPRPFAAAAQALGIGEAELLARLERLLEARILTRFGPLYDMGRLGGELTLCAMRVPPGDFERVAAAVNAHPEVAHNYERSHAFNMWFVVAADRRATRRVIARIEEETGLAVMQLPREEEYFLGLRLPA